MILAIDTAGPVVGAALVGVGVRRQWSERVVRGADALLSPALAELLSGVERLDAVAVSVGPGAFTSLRVGVAAALGVAVSRGCPVIEVSSLEARARACGEARVLTLLDGRKQRAYAAFFTGADPADELDIAPEQAIALASGDWVATGEGAEVWKEQVLAAGGRLDPRRTESPALAIAEMAAERASIDAGQVALRYLRDADAVPPKR